MLLLSYWLYQIITLYYLHVYATLRAGPVLEILGMSLPLGCNCRSVSQVAGAVASSVQWGAWGGGGMAIRVAGFMERMARRGLGIVQPAVGLAIMARAVLSAWQPAASPSGTSLFTGPSPKPCTFVPGCQKYDVAIRNYIDFVFVSANVPLTKLHVRCVVTAKAMTILSFV